MTNPIQHKDRRGVSPVIGVILMVAITVILAAVIGSFVLGIGGDIDKAPQASLTVDDGSLVHQGGDDLSDVKIVDSSGSTEVSSFSISPGGSESFSGPSDGDTIRVIHNPSGKVIWEGEYES